MEPRALVVERDPGSRSDISFLLRGYSYCVIEAFNWDEAMDRLMNRPRLDLIVAGVDSESNNAGCAPFIKALRKVPDYVRTPLLALCHETFRHRQADLKEAGVTSWIFKPYTTDQLSQMVRLVDFSKRAWR